MKMGYVSIKIAIVCIIFFVLQLLFPQINEEFALVSSDFFSKPWTIITYMFLHSTYYIPHLLYNMLALVLFGPILEKIIGSKRFLISYFLSGVIAGFGSIIFYEATIGASGAIFGILGTLAILKPRMMVFIGYFPMPMSLAVFFWALGNFAGLFSPDNVAYASHLFGLFFGLIYGFYLKKDFGEIRYKRSYEISEEEFEKWENSYLT